MCSVVDKVYSLSDLGYSGEKVLVKLILCSLAGYLQTNCSVSKI